MNESEKRLWTMRDTVKSAIKQRDAIFDDAISARAKQEVDAAVMHLKLALKRMTTALCFPPINS